ncbi:MAG: ribosome maturation factor RimM [Deltaproteobacteria bacterium]|nr:ribosome maturation factor RimM [Deltaproteobacteria bacterium]
MGNPFAYDDARLPLGVVGRAHATRGEVNFRAYNEDSRTLSNVPLPFAALLEDAQAQRQEVKITSVRFVRDHFLVQFEGITTRDQAETLTGRVLWLERKLLPPLGPGEYYWQDLVGCDVFDQHDESLGKVQSVFSNKAHGVAVVVSPAGDELLFPLVPAVLMDVNISERRVRVERLPEEDLNDAHLQSD